MNNPFYEVYGLTAASPTIKAQPPKSGQLSKPYESWFKAMFGGKYNPDKLTYRDYRKIMADPQIKIARRLINNYLLSKDYHITPASEDEQDKEVSQFIEDSLKAMDTDMREVRKHMLSSMDYGYSVSEKIWQINPDNHITPKALKPIQIETLEDCFEVDDYGEIVNIIQTFVGQNMKVTIPRDKCLIYKFEGEAGNPYGESIYKPLNDIVFFKKKVLMWLAIFLEKHGSPAIAGSVGATGNADALLEQLEGIREGRTSLVHESEDKVYVIESSKDGESFFKTFQMLEVLILRVFLIGSLVLGQSEASGSYAQSQTHMDALKFFLDGIHEDLAIIFQAFIKQIVDYNYTVEKYPTFSFEPFNDLDLLGLLTALQPYSQQMLLDNGNLDGLNQLIKRAFEEYGDIIIKQLEETSTNQTNQPAPQPEDNNPLPLPDNAKPIDETLKGVFQPVK